VIHEIDTGFLVTIEVTRHPSHASARKLLARLLAADDSFALAPQVLAEFMHVVTDERRFAQPLAMPEARERAERWWTAREVVNAFPGEHTVPLLLAWLREHALGRKRLLDTLLAATYFTNDVQSIITTNQRDFRVFGHFSVIEP
jgi:predicted nucleic acid-binding protein